MRSPPGPFRKWLLAGPGLFSHPRAGRALQESKFPPIPRSLPCTQPALVSRLPCCSSIDRGRSHPQPRSLLVLLGGKSLHRASPDVAPAHPSLPSGPPTTYLKLHLHPVTLYPFALLCLLHRMNCHPKWCEECAGFCLFTPASPQCNASSVKSVFIRAWYTWPSVSTCG